MTCEIEKNSSCEEKCSATKKIENKEMNKKYLCYILSVIYILFYAINYFINTKIMHRLDWAWEISIIGILIVLTTSRREELFEKSLKGLLLIWISVIFSFFFASSDDVVFKITRFYKENFGTLSFLNLIKLLFWNLIKLALLYYSFKKIIDVRNTVERKEIIDLKNKEIYPERIEDFEYIRKFIFNSEKEQKILGIDGEWGFGKTFVVDKVLESLPKREFEIIKINSALLEKEDVYPFIINNLDRVLKKNLIFTGHSKKIIKSLVKGMDNNLGSNFSELLNCTVISDEIENFRNALSTLNKNIIIVFDDIDRCNDPEKIKRILSFICEFTEKNIISIVLYSQRNLKNIDEAMSRTYIEKYIPEMRELTPVSFTRLMDEEIEKNKLEKKDFLFLYALLGKEETFRIYLKEYGEQKYSEVKIKELKFYNEIFEGFSKRLDFFVIIYPRNINLFFEELKFILENYDLKIEKRLIIAYMFLKHVMYEEFYEKITENGSMEKMFPIEFKLEDKVISVEEIDLIKSLSKQLRHGNLKIKGTEKFVEINGKRYGVSQDSFGTKNINEILNKVDIFVKDWKSISVSDIDNALKETLQKLSLNSKELKDNILIRSIFNDFFFSTSKSDEVIDGKEKIDGAIQKLKFISKKDYLSAYKIFYDEIKKILKNSDIGERVKSYEGLLVRYFNNEDGLKGIYYFGENQNGKTMRVLELLATAQEKMSFLEIVLYRNKNIITDEYIETLFKSSLLSRKITRLELDEQKLVEKVRENILEQVIEEKDELTQKGLNMVIGKIDLILNDLYIDIRGNENEINWICDNVSWEIERVKKFKMYKEFSEVRDRIDKYELFINKIKETYKEKIKIPISKEPKCNMVEHSSYTNAKNELGEKNQKEKNEILKSWFEEGKFNLYELEGIMETKKNKKN